MIRRIVAAGLTLLMPLVAVTAPLAHVHADDHDTAHHHGRALHAHFHGHDAGSRGAGSGFRVPGARIDHDESEQTSGAQLFVAVAPDILDAPVAPPVAFTLIVPLERAVGRALHVAHGHDPPPSTTLAARPPPLSLS